MCDPKIRNELSATVVQFLDEGRMFTGYDVTIETRERLGVNLRHKDVRADIHEINELRDALDFGWDSNQGTTKWRKSQLNMPGGGWAFVFHPDYLDPKNYQPLPTSKPQQAAPPSTVANSITLNDGAVSDSGGQQTDGTFATDYRDRLLVPTKFLKEAGIAPGETVNVFADSAVGVLFIVKDASFSNGVQVTAQVVERNGDIRLSSRTLKAANVGGNKYLIETADKGRSKVVEVKSA